VDYQLKEPFDVLQMDASGTLSGEWWAIVDGLRTKAAESV